MKKLNIPYKNLDKLKTTLKSIGGDKEKLGLTLLDEVLFCGDTLNKLKVEIETKGVTTVMSQGNYTIERENPALKSYNTTIKNYQALLKQIDDLIGKQDNKVDDDLEAFLK